MSAVLVKQTTKKYKEGEVVFSEGDAGNEMYIITSGRIRITQKNNGGQIILEELKPQSFFGEMALFTNRTRVASAVAMKESTLIVITNSMLNTQLGNVPEWFVIMFKALIQRLEKANKRIII